MAQPMSTSITSPDPQGRGRPDESSPLLTSKPQRKPGQAGDNDQDGQKGFTSRLWGGGLRDYLCCIPRKKKPPTTESSANAKNVILKSPLEAVDAAPLKAWADGVFNSELLKQSIVPRNITAAGTGETITPPDDVGKPAALKTGTYRGTKLALTQMTKRIEARFESFFDVAGFETSVPLKSAVAAKDLYMFQAPGCDRYPPHLDIIPKVDQVSLLKVFDFMRMLDTGTIISTLIPDKILDFIYDHPEGVTIDAIETRNNELLKDKEDIFDEDNFIGTNPTTLRQAPSDTVKEFIELVQPNSEMYRLLSGTDQSAFYVQDCSYFRAAIGADKNADLISSDELRRLPATVTLFQLTDAGVLHPLAIAINFKGSLKGSVVIFNKRANTSAPEPKDDWPWRYAKTCAQVSDWLLHEVAVHSVNTHFVEEVSIVAAHRAFSVTHPVYRLLQAHWAKTLSINAAARSSLVPNIITKLVGITDSQLYSFTRDAFSRFDWSGQYVPNDLNARGFPTDQLAGNPKYHNYAYGRNILLMWQTLHKFVAAVIGIDIHSDEQVEKDEQIQSWSEEMRSDEGGQLKSFPEIKTIAELVDAVTMCIHIASPQHTAINYLQSYYMAYVPNKPSALYAPLPKSLDELTSYKEANLVAAYPIEHSREWLLSSHVPHLLSYRVAEDQNLLNFALSTAKLATLHNHGQLAAAAAQLYADLLQLAELFKSNSKELDDQKKPYDVMDPTFTAVSILL
ncbi:hypothetical protein H2200_000148 [Cladophialophora chaetospira]|uniref:Manganese lipoxygenase n=1 Tax=Cladophialophora chaetospira TaxID=386627 RepID=A0AA38XMW2_9EURO|nr:hypothetical protein H2200_000148 [Cladophialophora chaetospira]